MKKKSRISGIFIITCLFVTFLFAGCGKSEKIENLLRDAEHNISNGKYEEARECYKEVLSLDKENILKYKSNLK